MLSDLFLLRLGACSPVRLGACVEPRPTECVGHGVAPDFVPIGQLVERRACRVVVNDELDYRAMQRVLRRPAPFFGARERLYKTRGGSDSHLETSSIRQHDFV